MAAADINFEQSLALHVGEVRALVVHGALPPHPQFFQDFVEVFVFLGGENQSFHDTAMIEVDAAVRAPAYAFVVRDKKNRAALRVQGIEEIENDLLVGGVQVSRWLIGQ